MSLGELKELNIDIGTLYDSQLAKEIIDLETSPLIANSLLLGYFAGNGNNCDVEKTFSEIGYDSGYIFQVMNDLEPFCQQNKLREHKGRLNTDIGQSKKNIAVSLLYSLLSIQARIICPGWHIHNDTGSPTLKLSHPCQPNGCLLANKGRLIRFMSS